jgi:hypothetical protein
MLRQSFGSAKPGSAIDAGRTVEPSRANRVPKGNPGMRFHSQGDLELD